MKTKQRILSYILAAAMLGTSGLGGYSVTAHASEARVQDTQLLSWDGSKVSGGSVSADGRTYEREPILFTGTSEEVSGIGDTAWDEYTDWGTAESAERIKAAFGIEDETAEIDYDYWDYNDCSYQWYQAEGEGEPVLLEGEDSYRLYDSYQAAARAGTTKFIRRITLDYVYIDSESCSFDRLENYSYSIDEVFTYQYDGGSLDHPIQVFTPEEQTIDSRMNGKQTFSVDAAINNRDMCSRILYQWYLVKDTAETPIAGETTDTLKVKITDPSAVYKCSITGEWKEGWEDTQWSQSVLFKTRVSSGYHVIEKAGYEWDGVSVVDVIRGEKAELYVDAEVDDTYSLTYKWERAVEDAETGDIQLSPAGNENKLEVALEKENDYTSYYIDEDDKSYCYRLTVSVLDNVKQIVQTERYYFAFKESWNSSGYRVDYSERKQTIYPGEQAEFYVKPRVNDGYTVKNTWYYTFEKQNYYTESDDSTDKFFEQEGFKEPSGEDILCIEDYKRLSEPKDGKYYYYWTAYYLKKVDASASDVVLSEDDQTLTVKAAAGGGVYRCVTEIFKQSAPDTAEDTREYDFELYSSTGLSAHAKNNIVKSRNGQSASLEVTAQNIDPAKYPILYTWKKYDAQKKGYTTLDNKTPEYKIASVKDSDYGEYQVEISDGVETKNITIQLIREDLKVVVYTPENSYFNKAVGDTVELTADIRFSDDTVKTFYEWYRVYSYNDEREILNEDASTYRFKLEDEKQYGTYKCIATYKDQGASHSQTFYYHIRSGYTFTYEYLTPSTQYKELGDSSSYSVRVLSDNPDITEDRIKYQWYIGNADLVQYTGDGWKIEGAVSPVYTIDKLDEEDFQEIYCKITAEDKEGNIIETVRAPFNTYMYTDISLENNYDEIEAEEGSDVTLSPVILNPSNKQLTYQWYRDTDYSGWEKITGAVEKDYTVSRIGSNEFGEYRCDIFMNGISVRQYYVEINEKTVETTLTAERAEGIDETVSAVIGSRVRLAVTAKSSKNLKLQYQWYQGRYAGAYEAVGGAVSNVLEIAKAGPSNYGWYKCVVKDEEGNEQAVEFRVQKTTNLNVGTSTKDPDDAVGYAVSFGKSVTLKASASINPQYKIFYEWYKGNQRLGDKAQLTISNIKEKDLGYYRCEVSSASGETQTLYYYVYVNTGLVVEPGCEKVTASANGSVKMFVTARANAGQKISYQWYKEGDEKDTAIAGANKAAYTISKLMKKHYGRYYCVVSTRGERYSYGFSLYPEYVISASREYAQPGNSVTVQMKIKNRASDVKYSYQWYAKDMVTGSYMKKGTNASFKASAPAVSSGQIGKVGYAYAFYQCIVKAGEEVAAEEETGVKVLPKLTFSKALPQTNHPNDKAYTLKAYRNNGAKKLVITFDKRLDTLVTIIDKNGKAAYASPKTGLTTVTVNGDSFIALTNGNEEAGSYGYKVTKVKRTPAALPKKGAKCTVQNVVYTVTKSAAKNGTVTVSGVKTQKLASANIAKTVKINGYTFKVTAINKNAFKGCKKLKTITVNSTAIKKVGANAFKGIYKSAKIKVPSSKLKNYKKIFKGKGQGKKVKIVKK